MSNIPDMIKDNMRRSHMPRMSIEKCPCGMCTKYVLSVMPWADASMSVDYALAIVSAFNHVWDAVNEESKK